jgi:hypothetical protein
MQVILETHGEVIIFRNRLRILTGLGQVHVPDHLRRDDLVKRARVKLSITSSGRTERWAAPFNAESIEAVLPPLPAETVTCYAQVIGFNYDKRRGYVRLINHPKGESKAHLDGKIIPRLKPQKGDYIEVDVEEDWPTWSVTKLVDFGDRTSRLAKVAERQAKQAAAADQTLVVTEQGQTVVLGAIPAARSAVIPAPPKTRL